MKTILFAAAAIVASTGLAAAASETPNSTNQHQIDSRNFYDNIPDARVLFGDRVPSEDRAAKPRTHSHPIVR